MFLKKIVIKKVIHSECRLIPVLPGINITNPKKGGVRVIAFTRLFCRNPRDYHYILSGFKL